MQQRIDTLEELRAEAERFVATLTPRATSATLVTLSGELGAGKTAFTKEVARALGVEETVNSPTFVLEKIYVLPDDKAFKRLIHIDAYRLEEGSELAPLGFDEIVQDSENLILLEWPEKVRDALLEPSISIFLKVLDNNVRELTYEGGS